MKAGERLDAELDRMTADGRRQFLLRNVPIDDDGPARGYAIYTDLSGVGSFPDLAADVPLSTD